MLAFHCSLFGRAFVTDEADNLLVYNQRFFLTQEPDKKIRVRISHSKTFHKKTKSMKFKNMLLAGVLIAGFTTAANAQVQVSASGSYLKSTGDNDAGLWGGGLGLKFFLGDRIAVGGVLHSYPKKTSSISIGNGKYESADVVTNVAGSLDFLLLPKQSPVQVYLGTDAGASFSNQTVTYTDNTSQTISNKNKNTFFLLSPKAGVNLSLGKMFGVFGQAQYNYTFGDGKSVSFSNTPNPFTTEPVSKYFTFDAGIFIRLAGSR
jgi:hypothetical protein